MDNGSLCAKGQELRLDQAEAETIVGAVLSTAIKADTERRIGETK